MHAKPFSTSAEMLLTFLVATYTKICTIVLFKWIHIKFFNENNTPSYKIIPNITPPENRWGVVV